MYFSICGVCSFLSCLVLLTRATFRKVEFQNSRLDDLSFTKNVTFTISQGIRSTLDCGRQCTNHDDCVSFTYSNNIGQGWCRGHSVTTLDLTSAISVNGARTYRIIDARCRTGWFQFQKSCYAVDDNLTLSWTDAKEFCRLHDSSLAEVGSMEENEFLKSLARNVSNNMIWLGGTDMLKEGQWVWTGSQKPIAEFTDWAHGEPNSYVAEEDCMGLHRISSFRWIDNVCNSPAHFVCKASLAGDITD